MPPITVGNHVCKVLLGADALSFLVSNAGVLAGSEKRILQFRFWSCLNNLLCEIRYFLLEAKNRSVVDWILEHDSYSEAFQN